MAKQKSKILIVDDSEMNRAILSEILSDKYDIIEAENGVQAIAALNRGSAEISLMLLDIVMPEMDGFEVLAYMNRRRWIETVPVIMISSEKGGSYIQRAYDMGVSDYINRPYDAYVVLRRIENTIMLYAKQRRLANMVAEQLYEREKSNNMMIDILSHIVEFRNGESGMHVLHIHVMTELLLRRLKGKFEKYSSISEEEIQLISMASSLHDIGKIGIPSKILNKPGRLTSEEFEVMKTHTTIGASMLSEMPNHETEPLIKAAYEICRWHHERYDGRGYPDGLKGDEIPVSAQIVSLADVYDALTSERCYKKAFSHEKAIEMIKNGECGTFSPRLIECLLDVEKELKDELGVSSLRSQDKKSLSYIMKMVDVDNEAVPAHLPAPVEEALSTARFLPTMPRKYSSTITRLSRLLRFPNGERSGWGLRTPCLTPKIRKQTILTNEAWII